MGGGDDQSSSYYGGPSPQCGPPSSVGSSGGLSREYQYVTGPDHPFRCEERRSCSHPVRVEFEHETHFFRSSPQPRDFYLACNQEKSKCGFGCRHRLLQRRVERHQVVAFQYSQMQLRLSRKTTDIRGQRLLESSIE